MTTITVAIQDLNKKVEDSSSIFQHKGPAEKTYLFESYADADSFIAHFNQIPQVKTGQFLKASIVPSPEPLEYSRPYLLHTLDVNHLTKRIVSEKVSMVTKNDIKRLRAEKGDDAPLVRAFDAFRAEKKIWDDRNTRHEFMSHGIRSGTPLDGDVVVSITNGSESIGGTYLSFFPDIRMRINASWAKTTRVHDDDYWYDEEENEVKEWIAEEDKGYKWVDCSEWYLCRDCDVDTEEIDEYVMIAEDLWYSCTTPEERESTDRYNRLMLCVGCIEKRIGRKLTALDFPHHIPLNWSTVESTESSRLRNRMTDGGDVIWKQETCELIYVKTGITVETKFTKYARIAEARRIEA